MPILVIKDSKSGCIDANVVPRKGECGFATKCAVDLLEFLGYKRGKSEKRTKKTRY